MGGMGILHRNLSAEEQSTMLRWVRKKIHYGGMIEQPVSFHQDQRFSDMQRFFFFSFYSHFISFLKIIIWFLSFLFSLPSSHIERKHYTFTSFPIVDNKGVLVGLMTRDEMDFAEAKNPTIKG